MAPLTQGAGETYGGAEAAETRPAPDPIDKGGLIPTALGLVPVTLGMTLNVAGLFFFQEARGWLEFLAFGVIAGTQTICYVAGIIGLDVLSYGDARFRLARRIGILLCILCPATLALLQLDAARPYVRWAIWVEAPYWMLSIAFVWLIIRHLAALRTDLKDEWFDRWVRVVKWMVVPLLTLASGLFQAFVSDPGGGWLEWLILWPFGLLQSILPRTLFGRDLIFLLFLSMASTGQVCFIALILLLSYLRSDWRQKERNWSKRLARFLFGTPIRSCRYEKFSTPTLWCCLFVGAIFLGGVACGMVYMLNTDALEDEHFRETLIPTVIGQVGACVAMWIAPGALFAAILAHNILAGVPRRLFHFLLLLAFVIVPAESCLLFTGVLFRASTRYPSYGYLRDFAWISFIAYPFAAALTAWLALRLTRLWLLWCGYLEERP